MSVVEEFLDHTLSKKMQGQIPVRIASFGCGVDSVAGLILMLFIKGFDYYDEIIFADTGSEKNETYLYLEYLLKTLGWKIKVVRSKYGKIYEYYFNKKIYPNRFARDCTGKFKIDVINKYLRTMYGTHAHFEIDLFIDYSESHRMRTSKYKYSTLTYPLIDLKLSREQCKEIISSVGMPVPVKSGCFFCPFTPPTIWLKMKKSKDENDKEYWSKSLKMEKQAIMRNKRKFPLITLKSKETMELFECGCFNYNAGESDGGSVGQLGDNVDLDELWNKP